jgi:hypothetical protein
MAPGRTTFLESTPFVSMASVMMLLLLLLLLSLEEGTRPVPEEDRKSCLTITFGVGGVNVMAGESRRRIPCKLALDSVGGADTDEEEEEGGGRDCSIK